MLNHWRAIAGVGPVQYNPTASWGAQLHANYLQHHTLNATTAHDEKPGQAGYTPEGRTAAQRSVVAGYPTGTGSGTVVEGLISAPLHALGMLHPELRSVGWGASEGPQGARFVMDVTSGRGANWAPSRTVTFPGNGSTSTLRTLSNQEWPNPLSPCAGYKHPVGMAVIAMFPQRSGVAMASLTHQGSPVEICWYNHSRYTNPDTHSQNMGSVALARQNAVLMIPRHPLQPGTYQATVQRDSGTHTWQFTIR